MIVIADAQLHYALPQLLPLLIPLSAATLFAISWHLWGPGRYAKKNRALARRPLRRARANAGREAPTQLTDAIRETNGGCLTVWTIYRHPDDYPDCWVLRAHKISPGVGIVRPHNTCFVAATLDGVRAQLPSGMCCVGRTPEDCPAIYESWVMEALCRCDARWRPRPAVVGHVLRWTCAPGDL